jgi:hypothetical protein
MTARIPASLFGEMQRKAKPGKRLQPERGIHLAVLRFLRATLPPGTPIHHSPNELAMSGKSAARVVSGAKHMGMMPGWPDIEFVVGSVFYGVEVKAGKGRLTEAQKECRDMIVGAGGFYGVVHSVDDTHVLLDAWGLTQ